MTTSINQGKDFAFFCFAIKGYGWSILRGTRSVRNCWQIIDQNWWFHVQLRGVFETCEISSGINE